MSWNKFTKGAKKAGKSVVDTGKKTVDDTKKVADDAGKLATDSAGAAEKAAKDTVDSAVAEMNKVIGTSLDWFEGSATGFSSAAQKLANDAQKELQRIGDLAQAILDKVFLAALEALVDRVFDDFEEFIDETLDILEDLGKDAAAATQLATELGRLVSPRDLTNAVKEMFVGYTRITPGVLAHAVLSDVTGFKSVSYGVFGSVAGANRGLGADGGLAAQSSQLVDAVAFKRGAPTVNMAVYAGYAVSTGTSDGVSMGVEAASWRDPPSNLAGQFVGVAITLKKVIGASIQFFFAADLSKFLGVNIALSASPDAGVDFDVFTGETVTYLF
jgi:hypothetical protein